jgi:hypothetical protein
LKNRSSLREDDDYDGLIDFSFEEDSCRKNFLCALSSLSKTEKNKGGDCVGDEPILIFPIVLLFNIYKNFDFDMQFICKTFYCYKKIRIINKNKKFYDL